MSRLTDLAAVVEVVSNVISKSIQLRQIDRSARWKTSSVMRNVGHERPEHSSYDTFYSPPETPPETQNSTVQYTKASEHPGPIVSQPVTQHKEPPVATTHARHRASVAAVESEMRTHEPDVSAQTAESPESISDDDILFLRNARRVPKLSSKFANVDPRPGRKFRNDLDPMRPSQADRYDVRSSSVGAELRKEQAQWRPQAAIDTISSTASVQTNQNSSAVGSNQVTSSSSVACVSDNGVHDSQVASEPLSTNQSTNTESSDTVQETISEIVNEQQKLSSSAVPSSRFSRLYHYTTLGASLGYNAFADSTSRLFNGPSATNSSGFLSSKNTDLLVRKLSRMRGAALKLGQMISFQDENLPGPIREVLQRVQDSADYMPAYQLDKVMSTEFGREWRSLFAVFDEVPIAAASIGQVHKAQLHDGRQVAVKVQYPGVANSISSDLRNLSLLLTASRLLPKGLYLDKTIENARTELGWECDYIREAANTKRFRELVGEDSVFTIPEVIDECSGKQVLTTEFLAGVGIAKSQTYSQELRDFLGAEIMRLCLRELAEFKFMQTDPNWTNFLYNKKSNRIELLDFGACRSFDENFIDKYCQLLVAAAKSDRSELQRLSTELGYLTGAESSTMVNAHISSILTLSEPFSFSGESDMYNFENQTITDRVKSFIPVMLRERLAPPPEETYSLHRRLSGHFLLCARLRSRIPCRSIFQDVMNKAGYLKPSS